MVTDHRREPFAIPQVNAAPPLPNSEVWLARYAKLVVVATFVLILIGGHTTTSGAGMAFADWPLSAGSLNPAGWWENVMQRLEHGHRMMAETVGLMIGILCAWVWRSRWSLPIAIGVSLAAGGAAHWSGASPKMVAHCGIWSAAVAFAIGVLIEGRRAIPGGSQAPRWLAFAAFLGVVGQAVLGGFRVTVESGGNVQAATALRIVHGCFAQVELCLVVALAAMLAPAFLQIRARPELRRVAWLGWFAAGIIFLQLAVGATVRHLGAGLAIPTFPLTPDGTFLPRLHNTFVDLNFTHTRLGAAVVTIFVVWLASGALRSAADEPLIVRPALLLLALLAAQLTMGMFVIWEQKQVPTLTTLHVVNGAALLATTVLLAIRASRGWARPDSALALGANLAEVNV